MIKRFESISKWDLKKYDWKKCKAETDCWKIIEWEVCVEDDSIYILHNNPEVDWVNPNNKKWYSYSWIIYAKFEDDCRVNNYNYKSYNIKCGSDICSFFTTCNIIKNDINIEDGDLIYFLENDYLHIEGWLPKIFELFSTYNGLDYVSLYDHNDKYFLPIYNNLVSKIITTNTHHWRTTPSTCGSFILSKEKFIEDFDILSTMEGDHNKFLWLNQYRNRSVITPIPGLSTHVMNDLLSPTINWEQLNN